MGDAIAHRGPDDEQFYDDGVLSLVFRRLSIVDLGGGRQPLFSADGKQLIVVNGEIYNHESLRSELKHKCSFRTRSDSEVALHVLGLDGVDGLRSLHGMFSLAFWDRDTRTLTLARDRLGIKPLYVAKLPDGMLFGSELKALLVHPKCPRQLDWSVLDQPVVQSRSPVTAYVHGVDHLPGGHWLRVSERGTEMRPWWRLEDAIGAAPFGTDAAAYIDRYRELLEVAVTEHLLSDVPVGLHLSGGLDSSLIAALAGAKRRDLACFTIVDRNAAYSGDLASARGATAGLRLPWFPMVFDERTLLDEIAFDLTRLEQSVYMMDSPRFDLEWILKEEMHRAAKRAYPDIRVVLLGQGADEFAGGYSHRWDRPQNDWNDYLSDSMLPDLRASHGQNRHAPDRIQQYLALPGSQANYHGMMRMFALQLQHFNLWHEDRTSMFQGLEARVPFLDHRLVELLASVPEPLHEKLFWNKRIVREAARRHMPDFDQARPKVPFFISSDMRSIDALVHEMLLRTVPAFLEKYPELDGFPFDPDAIRGLARRVFDRSNGFYRHGWLLMEMMVIAIFRQQIASPVPQDFRARRDRQEGFAFLMPERWSEVEQQFDAPPVAVSAHWKDDDVIRMPEGAEFLQSLTNDDIQRFMVAGNSVIASEISVPRSIEWVSRLLRNLGTTATKGFTVADWEAEFDMPANVFRHELDALYAAGFVTKAKTGMT